MSRSRSKSIDPRVVIPRLIVGAFVLFMIISSRSNDQALLQAASNGDLEQIEQLLDKGADLNALVLEGPTPLMEAAAEGHVDAVKLLLKRGAYVNLKRSHGCTALMRASQGGHIEVVRLLLNNRADVNAKDERNWTALTFASLHGHLEIAELLLDKGAKIQKVNGDTALEMAAANRQAKIVESVRAYATKEKKAPPPPSPKEFRWGL